MCETEQKPEHRLALLDLRRMNCISPCNKRTHTILIAKVSFTPIPLAYVRIPILKVQFLVGDYGVVSLLHLAACSQTKVKQWVEKMTQPEAGTASTQWSCIFSGR